MSENNMAVKDKAISIRLNENQRSKLNDLVDSYRFEGEATNVNSTLNKVIADWVDKGAIPIKYRTR